MGPDDVIDDELPLHAYEQLEAIMRARIARGDWRRVPSEAQLAQQYSLARATVRKALDRLRADGLIVTRVGTGTFVAAPPPDSKKPPRPPSPKRR